MQKSLVESSRKVKDGFPLALNLDNDRTLYIVENESGDQTAEGAFMPILNKKQQRLVVYGKSGSGKTTYCSYLAISYMQQNPKNNIWLFSPHDKNNPKEEAFYKMAKHIKQVKTDDDNMDQLNEIDVTKSKDFHNSLVIFDDIRGYSTDPLNKRIWAIARNIFYNGRKYGITTVVTNHEILDGHFNKFFTFEADSFTFFVISKTVWRQIEEFFKKYLKMPIDVIKAVENTESRWVTVGNNNPQYILTEYDCQLI